MTYFWKELTVNNLNLYQVMYIGSLHSFPLASIVLYFMTLFDPAQFSIVCKAISAGQGLTDVISASFWALVETGGDVSAIGISAILHSSALVPSVSCISMRQCTWGMSSGVEVSSASGEFTRPIPDVELVLVLFSISVSIPGIIWACAMTPSATNVCKKCISHKEHVGNILFRFQ